MVAIVISSLSDDEAVGGSGRKPSWREVAARSQSFTAKEIGEAAERIERLPTPVATRAKALLDRMAAVSLDAAGIKQALELLDHELPSFFVYGPGERPGQDHPHGSAVRRAALMLVHGLVAGAGARAQTHTAPASATAGILVALRAQKSFSSEVDRTRLEEELMLAVTSKIYFEAEKLLR